MKKLLVSLLFLFTVVGAYNNKVQAQVQLHIDALINFPDTAISGQPYAIGIRVKNTGNTPYQGPLQIGLLRDSLFASLYFTSNPTLLILPNDTVTFYTNQNGLAGFYFDSSVFKPGNNVVVVWPYSSQSVVVDSITTNVYVDFFASVNTIANNKDFALFPNPFTNQIQFSNITNSDIDHVRIFTLQGVVVYDKKLTENFLLLDKLPQGCYLLDAETKDNKHLYRKIVKE